MKLIMDNAPWCADFVFDYGLKRVRGRDQEYTSIETLVAQHGYVIPQPRQPRNLQPITMRFSLIQEQQYSPIIKETIEKSTLPIDPEKHVVVQYTGKGKIYELKFGCIVECSRINIGNRKIYIDGRSKTDPVHCGQVLLHQHD
jgi:hypothetical protein